MPLSFIRQKVPKSRDVFQAAMSITSLAKDLSDLAAFPPAAAAVGILLTIFEVIQDVQTNKESCVRLARRCARLLLDINEQMAGRWNSAPVMLVKNLQRFQETLQRIYAHMKAETQISWRNRFLRKASIEQALLELNGEVDEAAQSFQLAALINIQYALGPKSSGRTSPDMVKKKRPPEKEQSWESIPPAYGSVVKAEFRDASSSVISLDSTITLTESTVLVVTTPKRVPSPEPTEAVEIEEIISEGVQILDLEDHGFRRFHQSDITLKGKSKPKAKEGWWSGFMEGQVAGQSALIKRYEGEDKRAAFQNWLNDVKKLQTVFHPNLPQLVGFSQGDAPTPFIVLNNVKTRSPQALILSKLQIANLAAAANLILRFYRDMADATAYVQRQWELTDSAAQDFVGEASYRVDGSNTIILGLPPPKEGNWVSYRNYGLTESLKMACMGLLPRGSAVRYNLTYIEDEEADSVARKQASHLLTLIQGLLPSETEPPRLPPPVLALLTEDSDDEDEDFPSVPIQATLRQIRQMNLTTGKHNYSWNEKMGIPAHKFSVGDLGYIPEENQGFDHFVPLGNVLKGKGGLAVGPELDVQVLNSAWGDQWCWKVIPIKRETIQGYDLPADVKCWPIAVPYATQIDTAVMHETYVEEISTAWRYLLDHGKSLAAKHRVKPETLILITRTGTAQDFYIHKPDAAVAMQRPGFGHPQIPGRPGFGPPQHQFHRPAFPTQNLLPSIMYLFTSSHPEHEPYWSHQPMCVPKGSPRPPLERGWVSKIGWCTGSVNYVQLLREDFE